MYVYIPEIKCSATNTWEALDVACVFSKKEDAWNKIEREMIFVSSHSEFYGEPGKDVKWRFIYGNTGLYLEETRKDITVTYRVSTYYVI